MSSSNTERAALKTNTFLVGVESFAQYQINGRVVTVLGEKHLSGYESCGYSPSITVEELVTGTAKLDRNLTILLEFIPGDPSTCMTLGSKNIVDVYKSLDKKRLLSQLEGFDVRGSLLRRPDQDELYRYPIKTNNLLTLEQSVVDSVFFQSIIQRLGDVFKPDPSTMSTGDYNNLQTLLLDIKNHTLHVRNNELAFWITNPESRQRTIQSLQLIWMKVPDYSIAKEIAVRTRKGNMIILCGVNHAYNLSVIYKDFTLVPLRVSKDHCLNIIDSYEL